MKNLTTYINVNIMFFSALSCATLTEHELSVISNEQIYNNSIIPSVNTSFIWENNTPYSVKDVVISTETVPVKSSDSEDFETIRSFARKMLMEESFIDEEIQNVINDHFWDML